MVHDGIRYVGHDLDGSIVVKELGRAGSVVNHAVRTQEPAGTRDKGHLQVRPEVGKVLDVGTVCVHGVAVEVTDDVSTSVGDDVGRPLSPLPSLVEEGLHGDWTNAGRSFEFGDAEEDSVIAVPQHLGDGMAPGHFAGDELVRVVDERQEGPVAVETQSAQLDEGVERSILVDDGRRCEAGGDVCRE